MCGVHARAEAGHVECPICLAEDVVASRTLTLQCGHRFCRKCIVAWANTPRIACPLCRRPCFEHYKRSTLAASYAALFRAFEPALQKDEVLSVLFVLQVAASEDLRAAWDVGQDYPPEMLMIMATVCPTPVDFVRCVRRWGKLCAATGGSGAQAQSAGDLEGPDAGDVAVPEHDAVVHPLGQGVLPEQLGVPGAPEVQGGGAVDDARDPAVGH